MGIFAAMNADAPRNYWRLADPGGLLFSDIGATRRKLVCSVGAVLPGYTGPSSDGGSAWFDANSIAWFLDTESIVPPWSMEIWFWQHYRRAANQDLFSWYQAGATAMGQLRVQAGGLLQGFDISGNQAGVTTVTTQAWHQAVLTETGAVRALYLDGALEATSASVSVVSQSVRPCIGAAIPSAVPAGQVSCNLAEAALFLSALSAARVSAHFAAADQLALAPTYRPFGTSSSVNDSSTFTPEDNAAILASVRKTY